jgi:tetraprenyl-beta-curcumene synthase
MEHDRQMHKADIGASAITYTRAAAGVARQAWTFLNAVSRELLWGLPAVSREVGRWRGRAAAIPDRPLREEALAAIAHKRENLEGAALYSTLPSRRDRRLLQLCVAFQVIFDWLDSISERHPGQANVGQLHLALVEALDPQASMSDYLEHHPFSDDGGYLRTLVQTCQANCARLPSYSRICPHVLAGTARLTIQGVNHDRVPERRDAALKAWAERRARSGSTLTWFERTAAASGFVPYAFLALATEASLADDDVAMATAAYLPWVPLAMTMLDSYADWCEDTASGDLC